MANNLVLEVEVIRAQRSSMITSLTKMNNTNDELEQNAIEYKGRVTDEVSNKTIEVTTKIREQLDEIKEEVEKRLTTLEDAAAKIQAIQEEGRGYRG